MWSVRRTLEQMIGIRRPKKSGENWSLWEHLRLTGMIRDLDSTLTKAQKKTLERHDALKEKVIILLARLEENYGLDFWTEEARTDLQKATREVALLVTPDFEEKLKKAVQEREKTEEEIRKKDEIS
jgi:hypothetical protein